MKGKAKRKYKKYARLKVVMYTAYQAVPWIEIRADDSPHIISRPLSDRDIKRWPAKYEQFLNVRLKS